MNLPLQTLKYIIGVCIILPIFYFSCGNNAESTSETLLPQGDSESAIEDTDALNPIENSESLPLLFSPIPLFGVYHTMDYMQAGRLEDDQTLYKLWQFAVLKDSTYFTLVSKITGEFMIGYKDSELRNQLLWFLPDSYFFKDETLHYSVETNSSASTRTIHITHQTPDGNRLERTQVHALNPEYQRFQDREEEVKQGAADQLMFTMIYMGSEMTEDGYAIKMNGENIEVKRMLMLKLSIETRGMLWGGVTAGNFTIYPGKSGITQAVDGRMEREFSIFMDEQNPSYYTLQLENAYYNETQFFKINGNSYAYAGSTYTLLPNQSIELTLETPIPLHPLPEQQIQTGFRIHMGNSNAEITGVIHVIPEEDHLVLNLIPESPDHCASRPIQITYAVDDATQKLEIQAEIYQP